MQDNRQEGYTDQTPGVVTGAVACGVAPLPLLGVYTVIFLIHGSIKPVQPPDITNSKQGEFIAGWISLALFLICMVAVLWMLNGKRRWPLAIVQLGALGACIDFVIDPTKGGPLVPALLIATSLIALILMFAPAGWWWVGRTPPGWLQGIADLVTRRKPLRNPVRQDVRTPIPDSVAELTGDPFDAAAIPEEMPQPEPAP